MSLSQQIEETPEEARARRQELVSFLRARRASLQPEDVGLARTGYRRVAGLRRCEVAEVAAVSDTWYTWLEQGREVRTSPAMIDAVARALRLDPDEHRHLRRLAGLPIIREDHGTQSASEVIDVVDALLPHPAALIKPTGDFVAWNRAYACLYVDPGQLPEEHRNALWIDMMCPAMRERIIDWDAQSKGAIAQFRAEAAKYPGDPRFAEVARELIECSEFFRDAWQRHEVHRFDGLRQAINHPDIGLINTRVVMMQSLSDSGMVLMVHLLDDTSRERIQQLLDRETART